MKVKIIGNGTWGNAIHSIIKTNCDDSSIVKRQEQVDTCDVIIMAVPTQSIRTALTFVPANHKHKILINTSKGIEKDTHLLPHQIIASVLGDGIDYFSLIGPSFADEVVKKMPTLVNLGYRKKINHNNMQRLFQTDYFRVRLTTGIEALELSAAFKNIYAIACGLADGMRYGVNTRIKLIVLAMEEMGGLFEKLHMKIDSNMTAGTMGDLLLTCNSTQSRNFSFGKLLAELPVDEALRKVEKTVEGYSSIGSLGHFKSKADVKLPLATFISEIVRTDNPKTVKKSFEQYVRRI